MYNAESCTLHSTVLFAIQWKVSCTVFHSVDSKIQYSSLKYSIIQCPVQYTTLLINIYSTVNYILYSTIYSKVEYNIQYSTVI